MQSDLKIECKLRFAKVNEIIAPMVNGMELNEKINIDKLILSGEGQQIFARIITKGMYEGALLLTCRPEYIPDKGAFKLHDTVISLEKKNVFAMGANWFLNKMMGEKLDQRIETEINKVFVSMKDEMVKQISEMEFENGIQLFNHIDHFNIRNVNSDNEFFKCDVVVKGEISLNF